MYLHLQKQMGSMGSLGGKGKGVRAKRCKYMGAPIFFSDGWGEGRHFMRNWQKICLKTSV
jgi:hypothetical protein